MPLPSFLQRLRQKSFSGQAVSDAAPLTSADVELARARARRRLVGMVTQSDLVAALYEASLAHLDDGAHKPST